MTPLKKNYSAALVGKPVKLLISVKSRATLCQGPGSELNAHNFGFKSFYAIPLSYIN